MESMADVDVTVVGTPPRKINRHQLTQRNMQIPINRAPYDIVWRIFEDVAGIGLPALTTPEGNAYNVTSNRWMRILLVCKHWRAVALANPFLWNTIKCDPCRDKCLRMPGDTFVLEWLERARNTSLDIYIRDMEQVSEPVLQQLSSRTVNLRSFRVSTVNHYQQLAVLFQDEAPMLESLHIRRERHPDDPSQGDLPLLFGGRIPSLRYLSLNDVRRLGGNEFKNLTYLHISNQHYKKHSADGSGIPDLLGILRASPRLRTCVFKNCTCEVDNATDLPTVPATQLESIMLPVVQRLVLDRTAAFSVHILHRVALNDHVAVYVDPRDPFFVLPRRKASRIRPLREATSYKVIIKKPREDSSSHQRDRNANKSPIAIDVTAVTDTSAVLLRIRQPQTTEYVQDLRWTRHMRETSFLELQELWLGGRPHGTSGHWRELFSQMTGLSRLAIDFAGNSAGDDTYVWLNALEGEGVALVPSLRKLECHGIRLRSGSAYEVETVVRIARERHLRGSRLASVRILPFSDSSKLRARGSMSNDEWEKQKEQLRKYVDYVQIEDIVRYPQFPLPEVCEGCPEFRP